jgi:hypothetical protein
VNSEGGMNLNNDILRELINEKRNVSKLRGMLETKMDNAPGGSLRICCSKGRNPQYYRYNPEEKNIPPTGIYLNREKTEEIRTLAQKGYDEKMLEWARKAERRLDSLINCYEHNTPEIIYNNLSDIRKELIDPYYLPDDLYREAWERKWKLDRNTYKKKYSILTQRGELVRSKSEKIIADKLYAEGIPYVYEPEILLENGEYLYPDFAILNLRTRKEYFLEHFGKMDDESYSRRNTKKIEEYALNGYVLGDNFLCTFETSIRTFSPQYLDLLVNKYFK